MSETTESPRGVTSPIPALPAIAAAFVIEFDDRKGYTIAWQETINGLNIDGAVEFKSMPSGLHNVREDFVYFVYEDYAGISAVLNIEDEEAARKSRVVAVGVLVPLENGRMGKSWLHAESLRELAAEQIHKKNDYTLVEAYWNEYKVFQSPQNEESDENPRKESLTIDTNVNSNSHGYQMGRAMSMSIGSGMADVTLPAHHPALVLPELLRLFGPLIFPLVRAALLRKRILFLGEAPVERACNYVYNLSILSSLPKPIATILPDLDSAYLRLRPLFNIGVADIPYLESESKSTNGWIACTTDDVICSKPDLFDVLVILPSSTTQSASLRPYPKIFWSSPEMTRARPKYGMRASQRDAKRFANISKGLSTLPRSSKKQEPNHSDPAIDSFAIDSSPDPLPDETHRGDTVETASIISTASSNISLKSVVEPSSWSRIAYTSLVWWASAGDKRGVLSETEENENEQDVALLTGENLDEDDDAAEEAKTREITCVQYFHRWTNLMFTAVSEAVRRHDGYEERYRDQDDDDDNAAAADSGQQPATEPEGEGNALLPEHSKKSSNDGDDNVEITQEDMLSMGLDVWSTSDRQFVEDLVKFWWNRRADVQSGRIECCGIRIL